jgi:hypothetical protein
VFREWFRAPVEAPPVAPEVLRAVWFIVALVCVIAIGQTALVLAVR